MLKETIVKLDDNGAEVKMNESEITLTGKSINLSTKTIQFHQMEKETFT